MKANWKAVIVIAGLFGTVGAGGAMAAPAKTNRAPSASGCSDSQLSSAGLKALAAPAVWGKIQKSGGLPAEAQNKWKFAQVLSTADHTNSRTNVTSTVYSVAFYNAKDEDYSLNVIITATQGCKITNTWVDTTSIDGG